MTNIADYETYRKFFTIRFDKYDTIAITLIRQGQTVQRFWKLSKLAENKIYSWLKYMNTQGYNIYASASRLNDGVKSRTKVDFHDLQKVLWIELDFSPLAQMKDWEEKLPDLPLPNMIVSSSPGKFHIYWILDEYISKQHIEQINISIANYFKSKYQGQKVDSVYDISRVLRVPGFKNHKNNYYTRMIWFKKTYISKEGFCVDINEPQAHLSVINNSASVVNPALGVKSKSEEDIREVIYRLARLNWSREQAINFLVSKRQGEKSNISYYAELTVSKAINYINSKR